MVIKCKHIYGYRNPELWGRQRLRGLGWIRKENLPLGSNDVIFGYCPSCGKRVFKATTKIKILNDGDGDWDDPRTFTPV